jgi:hypothetical protein
VKVKGRIIRLLFKGILGCFLGLLSNSLPAQTDSTGHFNRVPLPVPGTQGTELLDSSATNGVSQNEGYYELKDAFDSLQKWIFTKETYNYQNVLTEPEFVKMTRLSDSLSPEIVVHGQYMQYRWRVFKGIEKTKKKAKKWQLRGDRITTKWNKRISYDNQGLYLIKRIEVPLEYRKEKYTLRFEMLRWGRKWYHVGAVQILID